MDQVRVYKAMGFIILRDCVGKCVIKVCGILVNHSLIRFRMLGLAASNFLLKIFLLVAILIAVISISNAQVRIDKKFKFLEYCSKNWFQNFREPPLSLSSKV